MYTGKGVLVLQDGRTLPLTYRFGTDYDEVRAGILYCDTSAVDHTAFCQGMRVICEDGTHIVVAVMHSNDKYLAVTGRVMPAE